MRHLLILCAILLLCLPGCDDVSTGAPGPAPILKPFEGSWRCNADKTLKLWKEQGISDQELAQVKQIIPLTGLHPDMKLTGDTAILPGRLIEGEYRFFALHPHAQVICGKAWHHEDRHDPGDMSKCLTRLELRNGDLYFSLREHEDAADPDDPDVINTPTTAGSAATCTADSDPNPPWSPWRTYIFDPAK